MIPAEGGVPKRLTWHPDPDQAVGWTPDGKRVLFSSRRDSGTDAIHLFTVAADGGFPEELPLPNRRSRLLLAGRHAPGLRAAVSVAAGLEAIPRRPDQKDLDRQPGGFQRTAVPRENSNDFNPMWVGDQVYFLSDRNGPVTLFGYDTRTKQVKQLVENHGLDFKSASAGPGAIVYEQFGSLLLYDLSSGQIQGRPREAGR